MAAIAPTAAAVVHVARSRHWIQPAIELPYTPAVRWVLRHVPFAQALHRLIIFLAAEWDYPLQTMTAFGAWRRRGKMRRVAAYMRHKAPPQYHAMLVPDFPISCKVRRRPSDSIYILQSHRILSYLIHRILFCPILPLLYLIRSA